MPRRVIMKMRTMTAGIGLSRRLTAVSMAAVVGLAGLASAQHEGHNHPTPTNRPAVEPAVQPVGPQPVAELELQSVDFGTIYDNQVQETIFRIHNKGEGPLIIKSLSATCGCTVPVLKGTDGTTPAGAPSIKRQYAPGEVVEIVVKYDPKGKNGQQHQRVTVETNDPAHPRIVFELKATVLRMINVEPSLVQFGAISKGETKTVMVEVSGRYESFDIVNATLTSGSEPPIELVGGKGETSQLSVDVWPIENATEDDKLIRRTTVLLTIKDKATVGTLSANLALAIKGYDGSTTIQNLRIYGEIVGDIQLLPNRINFAMVTNGQPVEKTIKIVSRRGQAFKILKVEEVPPMGADRKPRAKQFSSVNWSAMENVSGKYDAHMLTLQAVPQTNARTIYTEFVIYTDRKDEPKVRLKVYARVTPKIVPRPAAPGTRTQRPTRPAGPPSPAGSGGG